MVTVRVRVTVRDTVKVNVRVRVTFRERVRVRFMLLVWLSVRRRWEGGRWGEEGRLE